jgi:hypothetical protein
MATPTIAMIPSGYKAGTVYSVLPVDGTGDFTFTRASSATRVNESGLIEIVATGVPRLDYTGGGCPSLLLEPQATNLVTYSELFDNAYWNKSGASVVSGQSSPSGDTSAFKLVEDTATSSHFINISSVTTTINVPQTFSVFGKSSERYLQLVLGGSGYGSNYCNFDIENGVVGSNSGIVSSKITTYINGNYRAEVTVLPTSSGTSGTLVLALISTLTSARLESYLGTGKSIYIYGAQLEEQSSATSYIPTSGSTVTRIADVATLDLTPFTLTSITETIGGVVQTPITTIPSTYTAPNGAINKIIME